jgi:hypothetical protein
MEEFGEKVYIWLSIKTAAKMPSLCHLFLKKNFKFKEHGF